LPWPGRPGDRRICRAGHCAELSGPGSGVARPAGRRNRRLPDVQRPRRVALGRRSARRGTRSTDSRPRSHLTPRDDQQSVYYTTGFRRRPDMDPGRESEPGAPPTREGPGWDLACPGRPRQTPDTDRVRATSTALASARSDAPIPAADPVDDQAAVFLGCLLPREVTGVEGMGHAVREQVVEVLVVRPRHEVIVAPGEDLRWRGD